jgi:hypothetical protein
LKQEPNEQQQQEHLWRNILQDQLGHHYLQTVLSFKDEPTEKTPKGKLVKIRGEGGRAA